MNDKKIVKKNDWSLDFKKAEINKLVLKNEWKK